MKGLTLFITHLKRCKSKDEELKRINEELANIRSKFKSDKLLNGYQKKKYICKLVFIFLLGYKFEYGLMEAINLLSSKAYSEKYVGYLFMSVIMGENHNFMPLVISAVKNDLSSSNYIFQNLALQFIASSTSVKLADSLVDPVVNIVLSSNATDIVKQSAVLTLLQLLRIKSDLVLEEFKVNRLNHLISHHHLGLVTASASLIEFLTKKFPSRSESCMTDCIVRLSRIVSCPPIDFRDYSYYSVAAPWITIKLLRILQNFSVIHDTSLRARLREALERILKTAGDTPTTRKYEHNNAKYAVIFEAISLIIQMDFKDLLLGMAFNILGAILQRKEVNYKCMALEVMTHLSRNVTFIRHVKLQWNAVLNLLKSELDITIKKQAVDLLCNICSVRNVKPIVNEILHLLECEQDYFEDVALQTAVLAEQFGIDRKWYFETILKLVRIYGDKVSDSVWHSLVKIVRDDVMIQEYAAKASYDVLCENNIHDIVIKMAGYILGEFGYLIARDPGNSYKMQFNMLKDKYRICSSSTKALLLTTFMKFLNNYPDLKHEVRLILKDKSNIRNGNEEIQQRAVEYLKLSEIASSNLLATVLKVMPSSIEERSSTLVAIDTKESPSPRLDRISIHPRTRNSIMYRSHYNLENFLENPCEVKVPVIKSESHSDLRRISPHTNLSLLMNEFKDTSIFGTVTETLPKTSTLAPQMLHVTNNQAFLHNMLFNEKSKLYENDVIAIIIESDFKKNFGRFHLIYMNKADNELSEFSVQENFTSIKDKCFVCLMPSKSVLLPKGIMEQDMQLECLNEFAERPYLNLKFTSRKQQSEIKLTLPLTLNKFVEPGHMTPELFTKRWQDFGCIHQEVIKEFTAKYPMIYGVTRQKLKGFRLAVIEKVNPESERIHCAGIFHKRGTQTGFLVQLERYSFNKKYRSIVRSCELSLSYIVSDLLLELL